MRYHVMDLIGWADASSCLQLMPALGMRAARYFCQQLDPGLRIRRQDVVFLQGIHMTHDVLIKAYMFSQCVISKSTVVIFHVLQSLYSRLIHHTF